MNGSTPLPRADEIVSTSHHAMHRTAPHRTAPRRAAPRRTAYAKLQQPLFHGSTSNDMNVPLISESRSHQPFFSDEDRSRGRSRGRERKRALDIAGGVGGGDGGGGGGGYGEGVDMIDEGAHRGRFDHDFDLVSESGLHPSGGGKDGGAAADRDSSEAADCDSEELNGDDGSGDGVQVRRTART